MCALCHDSLIEQLVGTKYLPFYFESEVQKRGATFKQAGSNNPFVAVSGSGRLITAQQNLSGSLLGEKLVEALTMSEESVSATS